MTGPGAIVAGAVLGGLDTGVQFLYDAGTSLYEEMMRARSTASLTASGRC